MNLESSEVSDNEELVLNSAAKKRIKRKKKALEEGT
jgi:hypothetical protein